jgi:hypothetical protein
MRPVASGLKTNFLKALESFYYSIHSGVVLVRVGL